jgi:hypothetical protein
MGTRIDTGSSSTAMRPPQGYGFSDTAAASSSRKTPTASGGELSEEDQRQVEKLKQRDREVRAHEMAHMAAGGGFVRGGASFQYQAGPDGGRYAVGGEVSIDTSPVKGDPKATARKMQAVQRAALAPAQPSGQDMAVAAKAAQAAATAQQQAASLQQAEAGQSGQSPAAAQSGLPKTASYTRTAGLIPLASVSAAGGRIDVSV